MEKYKEKWDKKMFQLFKLWWAVCIVLLIESLYILCLV